MSKDKALSFAIRPVLLLKAFGSLSIVLACLTLVPAVASLIFQEYWITGRYGYIILFFLAFWLLSKRIKISLTSLQSNEVFALVALLFLLIPLVMTYPMTAAGIPFLDAYFEALSGATTTGLSTLKTMEGMPKTFLFARAWMQWYGGLGIVVFSLALLVKPGGIAKRLSAGEDIDDDLWGGSKSYARRIVFAYTAVTALGCVAVVVSGAPFFEGLLFIFAAVSTGGFAPHDASLASLGLFSEYVVTVFCLLGAVPLVLYAPPYRLSRTQKMMIMETSTLVFFCALGISVFSLCLYSFEEMTWREALSSAPAMAVSAQSTAGFSNMDISQLHDATKAALIPGMVIGGCVGSTGGGVKILRLLLFFGLLGAFLAKVNMPRRALRPPRLLGMELDDATIQNALLMIVLYFTIMLLSWGAFLAYGYDPLDSAFDVVSAVGTVGLSSGIVGGSLPALLKLVLCADMLMGRLEILAVLVLINPSSWVGRRKNL